MINFYYNKVSSLQSKDIDRRSLQDFVRISSDFVLWKFIMLCIKVSQNQFLFY